LAATDSGLSLTEIGILCQLEDCLIECDRSIQKKEDSDSMIRLFVIAGISAFLSFANAQEVRSTGHEEFDSVWAKYDEYMGRGDYEQSLIEASRGYESGEEILAEADETLAVITLKYGNALLKVSKLEKSRAILEVALSRFEDIHGKSSIELVPVVPPINSAALILLYFFR